MEHISRIARMAILRAEINAAVKTNDMVTYWVKIMALDMIVAAQTNGFTETAMGDWKGRAT